MVVSVEEAILVHGFGSAITIPLQKSFILHMESEPDPWCNTIMVSFGFKFYLYINNALQSPEDVETDGFMEFEQSQWTFYLLFWWKLIGFTAEYNFKSHHILWNNFF